MEMRASGARECEGGALPWQPGERYRQFCLAPPSDDGADALIADEELAAWED